MTWASLLRFVVATSTFCPVVAVLGAKRPQDSGWKFIVASLWLVLALPAIQTMLFGSNDLELHWVWRAFLLVLLIACWSNYILTKFWFAACLVLAAQIMLFGKYVPGIQSETDSRSIAIGMTIAAVAGVIVGWQSRSADPNGIDQVWRDFRNAFGAVWGLRVMERVNESGKAQGWSQTLKWTGFESFDQGPAEEGPPEEAHQIEQSLRTQLRRFVDANWIDTRIR